MTRILLVGRSAPGSVGETRRTPHIFVLPGETPSRLTAYCGASFALSELEQVHGSQAGMPCERCLLLAFSPPAAPPSQTG